MKITNPKRENHPILIKKVRQLKNNMGPREHFDACGEYCKCAKMWIELILLMKAAAECQKFERKMAYIEKKCTAR